MATSTSSTSPDQPNWISPVSQVMRDAAQRCRDARDATPTFRAKKSTYLPRFQAESTKDWQARVDMTVVLDFFEQAVTTLVGLGLRHDPELGEETPPELLEDWENLDGEGNHGAVVVQQALDNSLTDGHVVYFTEAPTEQPHDAGEQQAKGIRPYVIVLKLDQIPSWRTSIVGGERIVTQFVYEESSEEGSGQFGTKCVTRYRVYKQQFEMTEPVDGQSATPNPTRGFVTWELWEADQTGGMTIKSFTMTQTGRLPDGLQRIPARAAYGGKRLGILQSKPPLAGLAESNIRWGQVMSDRAYTLHKCGIPVAVIIGKLVGGPDGKPPDKVVLSPSEALMIEQGGDAKIIEAQGTALEQTRLELEDWEKRMGAQAISMLQRDIASAETLGAHRMQRQREESKLARALRSHEDALEGVLQDMAAYRGLDPEKVDVTIRRDFGDIIPPEVLTLLSALQEKNQLTMSRLLTELHRAGLFSNDFSVKEEVEALKREAGEEGAGLGEDRDLESVDDEDLEAELLTIEQAVAARRAKKAAAA